MLNFVKFLFCIHWNNHMVFILHFVNVVYNIDWCADIEPSLHPWSKSRLILVYDPFIVLLNSVCWYFVEDFCINDHQGYWPVVFFSCAILVWFWCQGNAGLVKWVWKCSLLLSFLEDFDKDRYSIFFGSFVEFTSEGVPSWNFVFGELLFLILLISMSLLVISLFGFSIPLWFRLGRFYMSRNLSISSRLSTLLMYNCSYCTGLLWSFVFLWYLL